MGGHLRHGMEVAVVLVNKWENKIKSPLRGSHCCMVGDVGSSHPGCRRGWGCRVVMGKLLDYR